MSPRPGKAREQPSVSTNCRSETTLVRVLGEIFEQGEVSVPALARKLGLKTPVLAAPLAPLARQGLIAFRKGRERVSLNPDFGYVVGIDLGASHLHYALADLRGEVLENRTEKIRPEDGPRKMIAQIKEGIRDLAAAASVRAAGTLGRRRGDERASTAQRRLLTIAIGVPSPVVAEHGVVSHAVNLPGWKKIHLGRELGKAFRVPVCLENDANMAALGEHWRGVARGVDNFVFIALGTGIGGGVFIDGKLHRGRTGSAGELFRMSLEWQRWEEDFGDQGYLETHVSGQGIAAEGRRLLHHDAQSGTPGLAAGRDAYFVFEALGRGDPEAGAILEKIFTMLGVGVANIVAVLDPELIVVGGGVVKGAPDLLLATVNKVARHILKDITPPIKLSALEDKAQTCGAIFSALRAAQQAIAVQSR